MACRPCTQRSSPPLAAPLLVCSALYAHRVRPRQMHDFRDLTGFALRVSDGFEVDGADDEDTPALASLHPMLARRAPELTTLVLDAAARVRHAAPARRLALARASCARARRRRRVPAHAPGAPRARPLLAVGSAPGRARRAPCAPRGRGPGRARRHAPGRGQRAAPRARARRAAGLRDAPLLTLAGLLRAASSPRATTTAARALLTASRPCMHRTRACSQASRPRVWDIVGL
jgi:hypothetical protein